MQSCVFGQEPVDVGPLSSWKSMEHTLLSGHKSVMDTVHAGQKPAKEWHRPQAACVETGLKVALLASEFQLMEFPQALATSLRSGEAIQEVSKPGHAVIVDLGVIYWVELMET